MAGKPLSGYWISGIELRERLEDYEPEYDDLVTRVRPDQMLVLLDVVQKIDVGDRRTVMPGLVALCLAGMTGFEHAVPVILEASRSIPDARLYVPYAIDDWFGDDPSGKVVAPETSRAFHEALVRLSGDADSAVSFAATWQSELEIPGDLARVERHMSILHLIGSDVDAQISS